MTGKIKEFLSVDPNSFMKRGILSSEFLLILIYIGIQMGNGTYWNVTDIANERIFNFVLFWVGARQIGKAVAQTTNGE